MSDLTPEVMQRELLRLADCCRDMCDGDPDWGDWLLWSQVCRDAAKDLELLGPLRKVAAVCRICGKPFMTCDCDLPF